MNEEFSETSFSEAIWDWLESRNYWLLLLALPALIGAVGAAAFAFYQLTWTPGRAEVNCLEAGRLAYDAGNYQRSRLAQQALLEVAGRPEPDYLYRLAQSYSQLGRRNEAVAILGGLAPLDKPGYPPAHVFLAQALTMPADVPPQALRLAETHLLRSLTLQPQNHDARFLLGQIYVRLGQWEDARKQLAAVVSARPEAALHLALTQAGLGDASAAHAWADRAARFFSTKVSQTPTNDAALRANWADALVLLNDYRTAAEVLETGWRRHRDAQCQAALARVCFAWAAALARDPASPAADRLQIILRGLEAAPDNLDLLRELALLSGMPGEAGEAARAKVTERLAGAPHAALLHLCLGDAARQRGELDQARSQYEAALQGKPAPAEAANQLAALLATGPQPDLDRALKLVEALLEHQPANPFFRITRGQILLRQGRLQDALLDLEFALPNLPDPRPAHAALAKVYAQLDLKELTAEHQRRATATNAVPARK